MFQSLFISLLLQCQAISPCSADTAITTGQTVYQNQLQTDSVFFTDLKEITVTATRPTSIVKADRISYIPSAIISGNTVYDALESIPGVSVESDGKISVNGERGITVNIDGRKSILTGEALTAFLRATPSSDIDKIDIITAPSARREASGPVTTINIQRRRKNTNGFSIGLNSNAQIWKTRRIYGALHTEYSCKGHVLTLICSSLSALNPTDLITERPYPGYSENLLQTYRRERTDLMNNIALSYDYKTNSNLSLGASLNYNHSNRKEPASMTTITPIDGNPIITNNSARFITHNVYGGAYLKKQASGSKNGWTLSFDFFNHDNTENQLMEDNASTSIKGDMSGNTFGLVGNFDWQKTLSSNWEITAGLRTSYIRMSNLGIYSDQSEQASSKDHSASLGSSFGYSENVNALYAEAKARYGFLTATAGLRAEESNLNSDFSGNESADSHDISRHGFRIYPSVSLMASTLSAGTWMLSYSTRVTRPRFADLDPFIHLFDDITHVGGNIRLRESISNSVSAVWTNGSWMRASITGNYSENEIMKCYRELGDGIVYVSPENLPRHLQLILTLSANNLRIGPCWNLSATATMLYSNYHFPAETEIRPNVLFTPMGTLKNRLTLPWDITAEISAEYKGRMAYGQAVVSPIWTTHIGLKKSFLSNKISLSVYMRDIFNTNHPTSTILLSGRKATLSEREFENMRKIGISLSFRFKGNSRSLKKEAGNTLIDEMNRVNL